MKVLPVEGLPDVDVGDDLPALLHERVESPDLVCVASTLVSKSEGRVNPLEDYTPSGHAEELARPLEADPRFVEAVLQETTELLLSEPFLLAVTRFGHVSPNAGVDQSNVEGDAVILLPEDPMRSASRLEDALDCPVIITDTCGRPFRKGQTGVAVGWSGVTALKDWRGTTDLYGYELEATEEAVVDELAGAANLLMGEGDGGVPAVTIDLEGIPLWTGGDEVFRSEEDDIVRKALREWSAFTETGD